MPQFLTALALFVGTHFLMSHPLRAPLVGRFGTKGFQILYSLVSLGTFGWAILLYRDVPVGEPLWAVGDGLWAVASLIMLFGSILFAGSMAGNPALPRPDAAGLTNVTPRGVLAITRHPMMWGFTCWSVTHLLVSPQPKVIMLAVGIAFLALGGSLGQDVKKAALMGDAWTRWTAKTYFIPLAGQFSGRVQWGMAWPGRTVFLAGTALWLVASWAHPLLGGPAAGIWRWLA